jgi:hypothetical protein
MNELEAEESPCFLKTSDALIHLGEANHRGARQKVAS